MILIIDNYDSFTYNLVQAVGKLGGRPGVFRNDETGVGEIERLAPSRILISPGPGTPLQSGVSCDVVRAFAGRIPIFGVCLGMQVIAHVFGARVVHAERPMHGKAGLIRHAGKGWLRDLPSPFSAMRYHSLVVDAESLPPELEPTAWSDTGELMALRHVRFPLEGVQFHPESYRTPEGERILALFLGVA